MPIYEYSCSTCGSKIEVFQGIKDPDLITCQECHQPTLKRLISAAGFRLKGGGWYETDFKKDTDKKKNIVNNETSSTTTAANTKVSDNSSGSKDNNATKTSD